MTYTLYFDKGFYPADFVDLMNKSTSTKHPKFKYANSILKKEFGARIGENISSDGLNCSRSYRITFREKEDALAFRIKYGY